MKSTCWDNPPIVKTKNSASLQLFCDCEPFPVPAKRNRGLHTANCLRFCAAIRDWEARNNCQSQKSCNSDRFLFLGSWEGPRGSAGMLWARCGTGVEPDTVSGRCGPDAERGWIWRGGRVDSMQRQGIAQPRRLGAVRVPRQGIAWVRHRDVAPLPC